ncbi:MAG TPA: DUF1579 family protein [Silvibacterium sp.]|nr:DUF1579 family protein [Silvibacterium sp.]
MRRFIVTTALMAILAGVASSVQAQMPVPKPAPEVKKLDYLAGTWKMDGEVKPGPMGPGGKMTMTGENAWMDGGFFLVSHSKFEGAGMGSGSSTSFAGYNPDQKAYTYDEFNSMGEAEHSNGTIDGDTWTWTSDEKMGGQTMKGRYTMKVLTPTSYNFKFELSPDGTTWNTVMDGKATKVK